MSKKDELSATMAEVLGESILHGGELIRLAGGFWTYQGCPRRSHDGVPHWYAGTSTIQALVARERMEYVEWKEGRAAAASPSVSALSARRRWWQTTQAK